MADTIVGAKSKLYIKESIPGIAESGDTLQHVTAQEIAGNRVGLDTVIHGVYRTHTIAKSIEAGSVKRLIKITAHGAKKGDILRFDNGSAEGEEVSIVKIEDADTFIISSEIPGAAIGDLVFIMRHVTPLYDDTGALNVISTPGPTSYSRKSAGITTTTTVLEDLDTPANSRALPVVIHSVDGAPIIVNAGDLSVSTSHVNDSMALGDGTNLVGVTANNELKTKDADVKTAIDTLNAKDFATGAKQDTQTTELTAIKTAVQLLDNAVATEGGAQPSQGLIVGGHNGAGVFRHLRVDTNGRLSVDINSAPATLATETTLSALNTKVPANLTVTANRLLVDGSGVTQPISAASLPLPTGAATEATLATRATEAKQDAQITAIGTTNTNTSNINTNITGMRGQLPTTLGQKTMANSMAVTVASDQTVIPVAQQARTVSDNSVTVISTAGTLSAPANAKSCKVYASKNNTDDVVIRMGGTATATVGIILEAGRSEDFDFAANISHISVTGTQLIHVTWSV